MKRDDADTELQQYSLRSTPSMRRLAQLRWTDSVGSHAVTVDRKMTLGSRARVDVVVTDTQVSRLHAELEVEGGYLWVRDLGSRNGTYVQGVFVERARVPDNGEIRVGSTRISTAPVTSEVELWPDEHFGPLFGKSEKMREFFLSLARMVRTDSSILVLGETGTGKELVARAIHDASTRAERPLVVVDCAALPENLIEAELFGHAKGAFTGAAAAREGAFEAAEGGTLFLDEVGELPLSVQPKLLRALESRTIRRIGETAYRPIDVRIVSATHRDLRGMVNKKEFREDLYFRLAVLPLTVPPLRERTEDIDLLVRHFSGDASVNPELLQALVARPWRGNVRELRNFVERAKALGPEQALAMANDDEPPAPEAGPAPAAGPALPDVRFDQPYKSFRERWADVGEREYLVRLLSRHDRNVPAAAKEAQLDRTHVYRLLRKHVLSG